MNELIQQKIQQIESEQTVRVLFACESGSRAWGFPSPDSDWDVRFIYVEQPDWYFTIHPGRDVIEMPINESLDISGWELRKALGLLLKSNPPLLEWLDSPILYAADDTFVAGMRKLLEEYFSPKACAYHYLRMAQNNYPEFMKGDEVKLKKYLYILRPVLGCLWLERRKDPVPMQFETMVNELIDDHLLKEAIDNLIAKKKVTSELGKGPKIPLINAFLDREITRLEQVAEHLDATSYTTQSADRFLRDTVERIWQPTSLR